MNSILGKTFLVAALTAAVASGAAIAQTTTPGSTDPSATQTPATPEPQTAPPSPTAPASAQPNANQANANRGQAARIAPGSVIPVQLTKTIDAKKAKPGDEVVAKVTMDLKTNSGEVIVPKDTKVTGHVTEAQARSKEQKESQVVITFDHASLKSGDVALPMSIQAVIAPPSNNANNSPSTGGESTGAPAAGGGTANPSMGGGRTGSAGNSGQAQPSGGQPNAPTTSTDAQQQGSTRPQITGSTQGVVGISNLKLEAGQNATQGSVLSSEKNNVKVESGTMLLLKVSQ